MLPGISGMLVSMAYVEEALSSSFGGRIGEASCPRALRALHRWATNTKHRLGPASSERAVLDIAVLPLVETLGYRAERVQRIVGLGFTGRLSAGGTSCAVMLALGWGAPAESAWREVVRLGLEDGVSWGLLSNGTHLVLVDAARTWSRRVLVFDLQITLRNERSAVVLWALARAEALKPGQEGTSLLAEVAAASDRYAAGVCASLGEGVLEALTALLQEFDRAKFHRRRTETGEALSQALTVVYRILFLLFAEARGLVPVWNRVYREAYTVQRLCERVDDRHPRGVWEALQAIARLAHAGCLAGDLRVTPFNGRLFAPGRTPLAETTQVPDAVAGRILRSLATSRTRHGTRPISYVDLGVEQLGSVYERVLEYEPARLDGQLRLTRTSELRKTTGSFYTPAALTAFLVRRTLHPLVDNRSSEQILSLRVVDPAMGSGAFLVAACRYLAAACERALVRDGQWRPDDITAADRASLRRQVAERCLYGVDLNPTAVQVARLSLWLATLSTDRPLSFLDHRLAVGDSLVGASLRDLSRPPRPSLRGRYAQPASLELFEEEAAGDLASVLPDRWRLATDPGETLAAVQAKEQRFSALEGTASSLARWRAAADLWCAAWFWDGPRPSPALVGELSAQLLGRSSTLPRSHAAPLLARASSIARQKRVFHWELAFPEVFFDADGRRHANGGFDAIIGNPPWDVVRADAGSAQDRRAARSGAANRVRFFRDAGVYRLGGGGQPNQYQLFLERALQLACPGGRFGLVLPSGLAVDHGSAHLRRELLSRTSLEGLLGFDNRRAIFPVHRSTRFLIILGARAGATRELRCRFGLTATSALEKMPDALGEDVAQSWPIRIDCAWLEKTDPELLSVPDLVDPRDLAILVSATATVPAFGSPRGWGARVGRELNATDDKRHFEPRDGNNRQDVLPVIEGKCLEPFRALIAAARFAVPRRTASTLLDPLSTFDQGRIAYREVAGRGNRLTLIAALLPSGVVSTHTVFCVKSPPDARASVALLGLLNSLVANYLVRLRVSTHVTAAILTRLPVPRPEAHSPECRRLEYFTRRLQQAGIESDPDAYGALNAVVARLYGLNADEYEYVVGTFPLLPEDVREACIRAYNA